MNIKKIKKIRKKQYDHYKQEPYSVYINISACMHFYGVQLVHWSSVLFWCKQTQLKNIFIFHF